MAGQMLTDSAFRNAKPSRKSQTTSHTTVTDSNLLGNEANQFNDLSFCCHTLLKPPILGIPFGRMEIEYEKIGIGSRANSQTKS